MIEWQRCEGKRPAYWADVEGRRLHVQQMRSYPAGARGRFRVRIGGVRLAEFDELDQAQAAAIDAVQNKKAPQPEPRGFGFDYREFQPIL